VKVLVLNSQEEAVGQAVSIVADELNRKPDIVLGLATGGTMLPIYAELAALHVNCGISFARVRSFNLDEYVGLAPDHPCSYHAYMRDAFFDKVDIDIANTHLPVGNAPDPNAEAEAYDARIAAAGGIDLQLLGIGRNGHIGFNEPTSSLGSRTRIKTLTENTRRANELYFDSFEETPEFAITMGIGTILDSRACLLLATGSSKAAAVAQMIEGGVSALCPASALQHHAKVTVVLDDAAAADLTLRDFYHLVHPRGQDRVIS
jgi:glucosamine-6-phosphate deaminase